MSFAGGVNKCQLFVRWLEVVRKTSDLYTVAPLSTYLFNQRLLTDDTGTGMTNSFPDPVMKVMYATYLYKGFPLLDEMHKYSIRLRESGLMIRRWITCTLSTLELTL